MLADYTFDIDAFWSAITSNSKVYEPFEAFPFPLLKLVLSLLFENFNNISPKFYANESKSDSVEELNL